MKKLTVSTFVALEALKVFMVAAVVARADAPIVNSLLTVISKPET